MSGDLIPNMLAYVADMLPQVLAYNVRTLQALQLSPAVYALREVLRQSKYTANGSASGCTPDE